jgi:hypothetical protein
MDTAALQNIAHALYEVATALGKIAHDICGAIILAAFIRGVMNK